MAGSFPSNAGKPSPGSWLDNWLRKRARQADEFVCGVRVLEGTVPREKTRWTYRRSAVDPYIADGSVTLYHGTGRTLRLSVDPAPATGRFGARPGHVVLAASERTTAARVLIAVPAGEAERFGVEFP